MTRKEAKNRGFTIDQTCYPHVGYKGLRFDPTEHVEVMTDTEAELLEACQRALISLGHVLDDYADIPETPEETEKTLDFVKMAIRKAKGIK